VSIAYIKGVGVRGEGRREGGERANIRLNTPEVALHHSAQDSEPERANCQGEGS
jgi:hypothetical protein